MPPSIEDALSLHQAGRYDEAKQHYAQLLEENPEHVDALQLLSVLLAESKEFSEAIQTINQAIRISPENPELYSNLGVYLQESGDHQSAMGYFQKALALKPTFYQAHYNLGVTSEAIDAIAQAETSYRECIRLAPEFDLSWLNLGNLYLKHNLLEEAKTLYQQAITYFPEHPELHYQLSLSLLAQGEYESGFKEYEWRWKTRKMETYKRHFSQKIWQGEDLKNKRILIHSEQGYGDTVQFVRFLKPLKRLGSEVLLQCQDPLLDLLAHSEIADQIYAKSAPLPAFDYYLPLLSLPYRLKLTHQPKASEVPYLHPDPRLVSQFKMRFANNHKRKIGITWAGNPNHVNDAQRSLPFSALNPILQNSQDNFFSVQKFEGRKKPQPFLRYPNWIDLSPHLANFEYTAAALCAMDLVITVDTAIAHLAGALGKPTWILLPYAADWRWRISGDETPWYPTVKLFRQRYPHQWHEPLQAVQESLTHFEAREHE